MRMYIRAYGFRRAEIRTRTMGTRAKNMRPVLRMISDDMMETEARIFDSGGRRGGGSWRADSLEWAARKQRKGLSPRTLQAAGALRESLTKRGAEGQILKISNNEIIFGSRKSGSRAHQLGKGKMPQRVHIRFTKFDQRRWSRMAAHYIKYGIGRARSWMLVRP